MKKSDPRRPPRNWYELKEMLATFPALLWVLFGDVCPLYDQIYKLWRVLNHPSIKSVKSKFTRIRCAHITWQVLEETRLFFDQRLGTNYFTDRGPRRFPTADLGVLIEDVRRNKLLYSVTMQRQWKLPRECKQLGNPPWKISGGKYASKWGFFRYRPKANKFRPLFKTSKKGNANFTREGVAGAKLRTPPSSDRQIYGKVPAKIFHTLFLKSIGLGKQDNKIFTKIWGKIIRKEVNVHAPHFEKMQKTKLLVLSCKGKIIGCTICIQCMHSYCTGYGLHVEACCSRHSDASSSRNQV